MRSFTWTRRRKSAAARTTVRRWELSTISSSRSAKPISARASPNTRPPPAKPHSFSNLELHTPPIRFSTPPDTAMKSDFSRISFDSAHQFTAVLHQQGRVLTDADFNEQSTIHAHMYESLAASLT